MREQLNMTDWVFDDDLLTVSATIFIVVYKAFHLNKSSTINTYWINFRQIDSPRIKCINQLVLGNIISDDGLGPLNYLWMIW